MTQFIAARPLVQFDDSGNPWLQGMRCSNCGAVFPGQRLACGSCGRRDTITLTKLSERGTLYSYTIVQRSFPGVPVPFVDAIVDLEGGGSIKGTLLEAEPDPAKLPSDMPVRVVFRDTGQQDREGRHFLSHFFVPLKAQRHE
jgi:uncharacterized OB-fold protein